MSLVVKLKRMTPARMSDTIRRDRLFLTLHANWEAITWRLEGSLDQATWRGLGRSAFQEGYLFSLRTLSYFIHHPFRETARKDVRG